jgi:hypothetical protein
MVSLTYIHSSTMFIPIRPNFSSRGPLAALLEREAARGFLYQLRQGQNAAPPEPSFCISFVRTPSPPQLISALLILTCLSFSSFSVLGMSSLSSSYFSLSLRSFFEDAVPDGPWNMRDKIFSPIYHLYLALVVDGFKATQEEM